MDRVQSPKLEVGDYTIICKGELTRAGCAAIADYLAAEEEKAMGFVLFNREAGLPVLIYELDYGPPAVCLPMPKEELLSVNDLDFVPY